MKAPHQRNRVAIWFETTRRPGIPLIFLVIALYAPSLGDGFILDDHRAMRVLREYHAGERPSPDVYRFLSGDPERNRAERDAGWYPWWMDDDLKYQHMRPLAEWALYGQYVVFGDRPLGYRLVGLALYAAGVVLVLRLLRVVGGDERVARWGGDDLRGGGEPCGAGAVHIGAGGCDCAGLRGGGGDRSRSVCRDAARWGSCCLR